MTEAIRITVSWTKGSVPREAGTQMLVHGDGSQGTIGGGALEWQAMAIARQMLSSGQTTRSQTLPLGPGLGQCCGGAVHLTWDRALLSSAPTSPVWLWGAGHVGRAIAATLAPLPRLSLTWLDIAPDRYPPSIPDGVTQLPGADLPRLARRAPGEAHHLILTHSHEIDLALCHALLTQGFASCGLIGSATKWARFRSRLRDLGQPDAQISRICCPIGQPSLGKHPQAIAVGVAAQVITLLETPQRSPTSLDRTGT